MHCDCKHEWNRSVVLFFCPDTNEKITQKSKSHRIFLSSLQRKAMLIVNAFCKVTVPKCLANTLGACVQYLWTGTSLECRQFAMSGGLAREQNILLIFHKETS